MSITGGHMPDIYYISDSSYEGLLRLAEKQGFTKHKFKSHRGISEFLARLSYSDFIDTRPDNIRLEHERLLLEHRRPKWSPQLETKTARCLTIHDEALRNYVEIALRLKIHILRRLARGGSPTRNATAICGLVLEALGAGWVTPTEVPLWISSKTGSRRVNPIRGPKTKLDIALQENPYIVYLHRKPKFVAYGEEHGTVSSVAGS